MPQDRLTNGELSFAGSGLKVLGVLFSCYLAGCVEKHGFLCDSGRSWLSLYTVNPCKSRERLDSLPYLPSTLMTCWVTVVTFLAFSACLFANLAWFKAWRSHRRLVPQLPVVPSGSQWFPVVPSGSPSFPLVPSRNSTANKDMVLHCLAFEPALCGCRCSPGATRCSNHRQTERQWTAWTARGT